ncbi:26S proteasome non-ATPase regulatory subunit 9-like isoform X2 [Cucurbita maxima]|uniref:26S proteasome non-ATPase regulatory subunit 9-like isoform X2 n=1 Tax=Cucurbita maxima TaxID=3661 RepID=A0A6J1KKM4_CUCMA|nr:26S proteasome non-ATPase regulatory subunit 9-like isoform X2 [Cucurbita maxima]
MNQNVEFILIVSHSEILLLSSECLCKSTVYLLFHFGWWDANSRSRELRNDHTEITEKINQNIQVLHSAKPASSLSLSKDAGNTEVSNGQRSSVTTVALPSSNVSSTAMDIDANGGIPFALVDEIADASPAADDGLQLGDQVLKFGNVEGGDDLLHRLASEAQSNQGRPIPVVVTRHGTPVNLTVTPRSWHGRGLLGCHFRML